MRNATLGAQEERNQSWELSRIRNYDANVKIDVVVASVEIEES